MDDQVLDNSEEITYPAAKILLVGESNPYGADPRYALYPLPERSAGGRLAKFLGLSARQYLRMFPYRRNLLDGGAWSAPRARAAADEIIKGLDKTTGLVLFGSKVAAAFGLEFRGQLFKPPQAVGGPGVLAVVVPHPSGRNPIWNDPLTVTLLRESVRGLSCALHDKPVVPVECAGVLP